MSNVVLPSNPEDRKKIKDAIGQIDVSLAKIEAEKEHIKDIVDAIFDQYKIPKKLINKLAKSYSKQEISKVLGEADDFETVYETLFGETR